MTTYTQFDFNAFNVMVNPVAPGLKIALAESLLKDALSSMERYRNPLAEDLQGVGNDLKLFRIKYKAMADARAAAKAVIPLPVVTQRPIQADETTWVDLVKEINEQHQQAA